MVLSILYKDGTVQNYDVQTVWQDHTLGMDKLYFELPFDEHGKGQIMSLDDVRTWQVLTI